MVLELIARGKDSTQHLRQRIPRDRTLTLGRTIKVAEIVIPWDPKISGRHAELRWREPTGTLAVNRLPEARNPIYFQGEECNHFEISAGGRFYIGETVFSLPDESLPDIPEGESGSSAEIRALPLDQFTISPEELKQIRFQNADNRIDVLSRMPELIAGAVDDGQLYDRLVNMLLAGITRADVAAVVALGADGKKIEILRYQRRRDLGGRFRPSARLVREAHTRGQSIHHVWQSDAHPNDPGDGSDLMSYSLSDNVDWAFCTPVRETGGPWRALYIAGARSGITVDTALVREDMKFADLVASVLGALTEVRQLQHRQNLLGQCFSPVLLQALEGRDPEQILNPKLADVSVLFCDLRGFSTRSENADNLLGLLERISQALGVMTEQILLEGGVVGDFQGDSAMGFWGWPLPQDDATALACRAALRIRKRFDQASREPDHPLFGFQAGVGIATGRAVAGKLGTADQAKFSVFGPVVNLASRLEGMTKIFRAPILIDEETYNRAKMFLNPNQARFRRLARVIPKGLRTPLCITELLPDHEDHPALPDDHIILYEQALDALINGDWELSYRLLAQVSPEDQAKDYLMGLILRHHRQAPDDWEGVIRLETKA